MKYRLYDKDVKARGTIGFDNSYQIVTLQFRQQSAFLKKFRALVRDFLKKEGLKIVSGQLSFRKHYDYKSNHKKMAFFDVYYKYKNPRTQRVELKKVGKK